MSKFVLTAQLNLQAPRNTNQVLNKIRSDFKGISVPVELQGGKEASRTAKDLTKNLKDATNQSNKLAKSFVASTRRFLAFAAAGRALSLVTNNLANAVSEAIDFERELIKISQVTGKTVKELGSLNREIKNLSTSLGVSSTQLLSVGRILSQAGFKARELEIALAALAKTELAPTFENIEQTAEGVVAIFNQFRKGAEALEAQLGAINAVAGRFAVESGDLISAIRRVGGVFESAGGSLEELLGLFTSVRATTRESAESIATGLRTILTRIQRPKTIAFLKQFGVELEGLDGKFVGPFEAVKRLSAALDDLPKGSLEFVRIAEELGGFRQIGKVIPLLQQFSTAERARQVALAGSKSLDKDAAKAQQALAVQIQKTREQFSALVRDVVQSNTFKVLAAGALAFANALIQIGNAIKPILPLLTVLAGVKLGGFAVNLGKATVGSLKSFAAQGRNQGGFIEPIGFNSGGLVPGSGNRDTVPAMLTPGEFVIRKKSVEKLGLGKLSAANNYAFGGTVDIESRIGQINPTGEPATSTSEKRVVTAARLAKFKGVEQISSDIAKLNPNDEVAIAPTATQVATLDQDFDEKTVLGPGLKALDDSIRTAIPKGLGRTRVVSIKSDPQALKVIGGYAFERFSGALLNAKPSGEDAPFDLVGANPTKIASQSPFAPFLDAKRTRVGPREIVNKALNESAVKKSFTPAGALEDDVQKAFLGGFIQALNAGGLVNENDIGAAILEAGGSESSSVSVTQDDVNKKLGFSGLARGASPADRYFTSKTFGVQKQGLDKTTSDNFSNALKAGFAAGTDNAVAAVAGDLGLPASTIPASDVENFYSGVRTSLIGDLFEATLRSLKGGGRFSDSEDPARPFDFVGGLGAASDNFPGVSSLNYVDAKSTFDAASDKELKKKAVNQIAFELQAAGVKDQPVGTKKALANRGESVPDLPGFPKRKGFATGGPAGSDTVPAMLTPGEFVINKKSAQRIGYANLNKMNKRGVMGFAKGGAVPGVQYLSDGASVGNQLTEFTSAQIVGAIEFLGDFTQEAIDAAAFYIGESIELITDYFKDQQTSTLITELQTIGSAVVASSQNIEGKIVDVGELLGTSIATDIGELQSTLSNIITTAADGIASDNDSALVAGFARLEGALGAKDANSELKISSPELLSAIQQVASDVGNRLNPVIDQTNNTLERIIGEIQNSNSLIADSSSVIKESLASLGATFTDSQQVDAASGEPSDPSVFEIAAGSLVGLAADTIDALSSANADKIGAILGAGPDAAGGGGPASDVAFDGTAQSLADLQGDLQARIEELTQASIDAAANGFPLLQAKIEEGIRNLADLQIDNALQASSQGNQEREGKNLDLLQEIDTSNLNNLLAESDELGRQIGELNAAIIEAIQTTGEVDQILPDGSVITRPWEEAADIAAALTADFVALGEEIQAVSGDLQATDEAILDNAEAYNKAQAELAENFQIANEPDDSKCVSLCPGQDLGGGGGFNLPQARSTEGVDAASGEDRSDEQANAERTGGLLDNPVLKLGAAVSTATLVVNKFTSGIDENSSEFAQAAGSIAEDALAAGTSIGSLNVATTQAVGALTGLKDVKVKDLFERGAVDETTGKRAKTQIESRFDDIGKNLKSKFEGFGDVLEKKGLPTFGKLSKKVSGLGNIIGKAGPIVGRFTVAAQTAAQVTGFLAKTIDNITGVNRKAEQAIKAGNIERARTTAIEAQRAKDVNKVAMGVAVAGAAVGSAFGPLGTVVGAVVGAIAGLTLKIISLTGVFDPLLDLLRNSSIGAALGFSSTEEIGAQAATKAAEAKLENERARNDLNAGRAKDRIAAGESTFTEEFEAGNLTGNINNELLLKRGQVQEIEAAKRRNQTASSSAGGQLINSGFALFGSETLADESDRLAREADTANADLVNTFRSNSDIYKDAAAGFAAAGGNAEQIKKKLEQSLQPFLDGLDKNSPAYQEVQDDLQKISDRAFKASEKQKEYIKSLNFGLKGVNNNIGAVTSAFSLLDQAATTGVTQFEIAAAKLETALSSAAGSLSPDEIEKTVDSIREGIISAGGTTQQADKAESQFRGFQEVFAKFDQNSGGFKKLQEDLLNVQKTSGTDANKFRANVASVVTQGIDDEDVKNRVTRAIESGELNDGDLKALSTGDLSPIEKLLGPTFEKFKEETGGVIAKVNEAQRSLISSIEARKAAEDSLVEAQRKTIDLQIEAAGLLDTLRPKALGAPSAEVLKARNEGFARERFNVGARISGGRALTSGSTSDIRGSLQFLRNRQVNSRTETNRLVLADQATASVERSEADQSERDAAQAEELLAFTRTRIQEEQKLIETIKQRNAAEKSALESLLAGDIEAFIQQQEAAGAAAALETGSASLAGLFDAGALGAGALALQERGALTSDAANLALSAFGVNNPQAGQVLAEQTPEIQAAQREIESLAQLLPEFGRALEDIKRTEIKAEQAIINAKQVKLDNARRDAEANPAGVAETLATTVGAAKEVVEGAKALDNGLSITSKAVGDSASLLGEAVQNLANSTLDVNINGDFVKGLVNPQDIVSALTSQIGPVIAKQIAAGLKGIKIGNDGEAGQSDSPLKYPTNGTP